MKYLDLAVRIAKANAAPASYKHYLFGAVCVRYDGAIVVSNNIRVADRNLAAHCEARILKKSGAGATLWLARVDRNGQWAMAKPCVGCASLIKNRNVKRVYYTIAPNTYAIWNV